jgi:hypothetical protein
MEEHNRGNIKPSKQILLPLSDGQVLCLTFVHQPVSNTWQFCVSDAEMTASQAMFEAGQIKMCHVTPVKFRNV